MPVLPAAVKGGSIVERRDDKRRARRVAVRFWKKGEEKPRSGFTTNISNGGMFIGSSLVHGRGTRLRIEVLDPGSSFMVEGVVARAIRTQPALQGVRPSGMGIRFLQVSELVAELFPPTEARVPERPPLRLYEDETARLPPPEVSSPPMPPLPGLELPGLEMQAPTVTPPPPSPGSAPTREPEPPDADGRAAAYAYTLQYRTPSELRTAYERDIAQGGLFITTPAPAPLQKVISIDISVFGVFLPPVRLFARVVHRTEPGNAENPNLLAGMGLELLDPEQARIALRPLVDHAAVAPH